MVEGLSSNHNVVIQAKGGYFGKPLDLDNSILYGVRENGIDSKQLSYIADKHKIDLCIVMLDIWGYDFSDFIKRHSEIVMVCYYLMDTTFMPSISKRLLISQYEYIITMSNSAKNAVMKVPQLKNKYIDTIYVPFDTKKFDIVENVEINDRNVFKIAMVQMNRDIVRKDQKRQLFAIKSAFEIINKKLKERGDKPLDYHIYCHFVIDGGFNLIEFAKEHNMENNISHPSGYKYMNYNEDEMAKIYNSADLVMQCTTGEGFGMPTVEAMLCGVPVLGSENTATEELLAHSILNVAIECKEYMYLGSTMQKIPSYESMVLNIVDYVLENELRFKFNIKKRKELRNSIIEKVDNDLVVAQWESALLNIETIIDLKCAKVPNRSELLRENAKEIEVIKW